MRCPYCQRYGVKKLNGYCCKAHRKLHRNPPPKIIPCANCGSPQRRVPSNISKSGAVYCTRCKRPKGEQHYRFKEGSYVDRTGYKMLLVNGYYIREHRLVWERANKACLLPNGTIHHVRVDLPHNKLYNDPDNLVLVSDTEHGRFHRLIDAGRYEEAFDILKRAGKRQLHYPREIDNYMLSLVSNE